MVMMNLERKQGTRGHGSLRRFYIHSCIPLDESLEKVRIRNKIREFFGFGFALQDDCDIVSVRTPVKYCSDPTYDTCL